MVVDLLLVMFFFVSQCNFLNSINGVGIDVDTMSHGEEEVIPT